MEQIMSTPKIRGQSCSRVNVFCNLLVNMSKLLIFDYTCAKFSKFGMDAGFSFWTPVVASHSLLI